MLSPTPIVHDRPSLADVLQLLSLWPGLADHPERLAACLEAGEQEVRTVLEALVIEGEVLA
jgi:hypothetical protein